MTRPKLIFNEDCTAFLVNATEDRLSVEGCQGIIDKYSDSGISHLFLNWGDPTSTSSHTILRESFSVHRLSLAKSLALVTPSPVGPAMVREQ